ncbi:MAG: SurA N-terminal domain-containing protein [Mariprofundus sp.]|nr:SurA N-terminal domain-containing protein [Mariprofundus sp.]
MLESMRKHAKSWVAKIILGGIALSFVLWGVGDYFTGGNSEPVATINDTPVSNAEFYQAYNRQINYYRSMLGKQYSKDLIKSLNVKDNTLQTIINRRVMLNTATELGLTAPNAVVLATVTNNPSFQSAGEFDPKRYQALTRNMGFGSEQDYENDVRLNVVVDALQQAIVGSVHVSDAEIRERFDREYEQRVLVAIVVDPVSVRDQVTISEADAKAWYESHKGDYQSPLRIKVNTVEIDPSALAVDMSVDESDIQAAYDAKKGEFVEAEQRKARHVLIKAKSDSSEAERLAARAKIEAVQARIKAGEDFSKIAKEVSEDSTAEKGGDLGWFKPGAMVSAFDQAVFAMEKGSVSGIVETQFGYHLIQLDDIRPATTKSYAEMKDTLRVGLLQTAANNEAYNLSQNLDDALGMEDSLKAAADVLNLKMNSSNAVSLQEAELDPMFTDVEIRSKAFATLPGQPIEIVEASNGTFVALEVVERIEPDTLPYEDVAAKVKANAKVDASNKKARDIADIIRTSSGKSLDQLAQEYGQAKYISKPVRSNGEGDSASWLSRSLLNRAFSTASGSWVAQSIKVPQGYAAVRVEKTIAPAADAFNGKKEAIRKEVEKTKGNVRFARFMASVRDRYDIVTNQRELERF